MDISNNWISTFFGPPNQRNLPVIIVTTALTTFAIHKFVSATGESIKSRCIKSPTATLLPTLTSRATAELPYPPDALPGGRNVESPYGTIKVYEWGPVEGRKVLLVHGISTPCIALGAIAHLLVEKGCRVMTFDLFGRGYSDASSDLPHDDRLYSTQIFLALSSSPLSWTGSGSKGKFSLIGYSLGGGISAAFTAYFSPLVDSLVLLAPSGLLRSVHMSGRSKFLYSTGFMPEGILQWLVKRRLRAPMYANKNKKTEARDPTDAVAAKVKDGAEFAYQDAPLSKTRPEITIVKAVQWQLDHHNGFVHAFMSSIRHAPILGQHETWRKLAQREKKTLVIAGAKDPIIYAEELREDLTELIGNESFEYRVLEGAHDFPIVDAERVVNDIWAYWQTDKA